MNKPLSRQRATGRVTLADVATATGVSTMTVSRALRGGQGVNQTLADNVRQAARKLGYVPDPAARALASQRSSHVAILIPMLTNELFVALLESAQALLRKAGYQTLIGVTHYDPGEEEMLLREQLMHWPAGLLLTGFDHSPATRALLDRVGVPIVHLMEAPTSSARYSVGFSQVEAGAALTQHLFDRGFRRIAFAAAQLDPRTLQRMEGWRRVMQAQGRYEPTLEWLNAAPSSMVLGGVLFEQIMGQNPAVDAIFFCNDDLAQGALLAANRMGIAVPQRVAIVGFNDLRGSDLMLPPLTTVQAPMARIGADAVQMLLELMAGTTPAVAHIDVGFSLVVRQSS